MTVQVLETGTCIPANGITARCNGAHHGVLDVVVAEHSGRYEDVLVAQEAGAAAVQLGELGASHGLELEPVLGRHTVPDLHPASSQLQEQRKAGASQIRLRLAVTKVSRQQDEESWLSEITSLIFTCRKL